MGESSSPAPRGTVRPPLHLVLKETPRSCGWQRPDPLPALQVEEALTESKKTSVADTTFLQTVADFWGRVEYYNYCNSIFTQTSITLVNACERRTSERFSSTQRKGIMGWRELHSCGINRFGEILTSPLTVCQPQLQVSAWWVLIYLILITSLLLSHSYIWDSGSTERLINLSRSHSL